jgi:hypothetical protein
MAIFFTASARFVMRNFKPPREGEADYSAWPG